MKAFSEAAPWKRWGAFFIDILIVYLQSIVLLGFASAYFHIQLNMVSPHHLIMAITIFLLIGWGYFAMAESSQKQATIGKRALGILVTDLQGNRISLLNATRRYWIKVISGFLFVALIMKKRPWHDELTGSLVLDKVALAPSSVGRKPAKAVFA